jgi:iron complex outermembrane recepter protein
MAATCSSRQMVRLVPYDVGEPTGNAIWSIGGEGLFLPDVTNLYTPYDRTLVNSYLTYELADNVEFFGEFFYANTNARELINQSAYQSGLFGEESFALNFSVDHPLLSESARQTLTDFGATVSGCSARRSTSATGASTRS